MAKIEKVEQQYFGSPQSAFRRDHYPDMPTGTGLKALGAGITDISKSASQIFDSLTDLAKKGQKLALEQARAEYDSEVAQNLENEVFSLSGISAVGAGKKAQDILRTAENRQLEKLAAYGALPSQEFRDFSLRAGAGHLSRAISFERREVQRATIATGEATIKSRHSNFGVSGSDDDMSEMLRAFNVVFSETNGRIITKDKLDAFNRLFDKGYVNVRGEDLKIVDEIEPGAKGVISRAAAEDLQKSLGDAYSMWQQGRQNLIDTALANRMDQLLKSGDLQGAYALLAKYGEAARAQGKVAFSESAERAAREGLKNEGARLVAIKDADSAVAGVLAEHAQIKGTGSGNFFTPELGRLAYAKEEELRQEAMDDPTGKAWYKYNHFQSVMSQAIAARKANTDNAIKQWEEHFAQQGLYAPERVGDLMNEITKMPDSPVKQHFMWRAAKSQIAASSSTRGNVAPEREGYVKSAVGAIIMRKVPGYENADFSALKQEDREALLNSLSLAPAEQKKVIEYLTSDKAKDFQMIAQVLAEELNRATMKSDSRPADWKNGRFSQHLVCLLCPDLIDKFYQSSAGQMLLKTEKADKESFIRSGIRALLQTEFYEEDGSAFFNWEQNLAEYYARFVDEDGNLVDEYQTVEWNPKTGSYETRKTDTGAVGTRAISLERAFWFGLSEENKAKFVRTLRVMDGTIGKVHTPAEDAKYLGKWGLTESEVRIGIAASPIKTYSSVKGAKERKEQRAELEQASRLSRSFDTRGGYVEVMSNGNLTTDSQGVVREKPYGR